jgi:hypothetical protein
LRRCAAVFLAAVFCAALLLTSCGSNTAATNKPAANPSPTPTPTPSAGTTVLNNVEDTSTWLTCGNCGNDGATGPAATYSFTPRISSPSEDGSSTQFSIAATVPYTNAYFYQEQAPVSGQINAITYAFDIYIPPGMETAPQAIEFECQQMLGGWVYNFGWQAFYPLNVWRIFDYGLKRWDTTSISFTPFTPGTWHRILAEYHNDITAHIVYHDALTVDGVRYPVNVTHNAFFGAGNDQLTNAVQLDSNSTAAPYSLYLDKMMITYR